MKQNKAKRYFYLACLFVVLSLIGRTAYRYITKPEEDKSLEKAFTQAVKQIDHKQENDSLVIDVKSLTNFQWDSLLVFGWPFDADYIQKRLGYKWNGATKMYEKDHMFIFIKEGKVVAFVYFEGGSQVKKELNFVSHIGVNGETAFTPKTAVFIVSKSMDRIYIDH